MLVPELYTIVLPHRTAILDDSLLNWDYLTHDWRKTTFF